MGEGGIAMSENAPSEVNRRSLGTAFACCTGILFGPGPAVVAGLGLLMTAVAEDFGWSRTTFSAVPMVGAWAAALSSPFFGRWMDRFGLRKVLISGIAAFGLAFMTLAFVGNEAWMFFGAYVLVGLASGSQGPVGYNKVICQWFVKHRGKVIAFVAATGSGLGYALAPQAINYLIVNFGWRTAYMGISLSILLISLPIVFFFLRENRARMSSSAQVDNEFDEGITREEGLRTPSFWKLALILVLGCLAYYGIMLHLFPMLLDEGIDRGFATSVISVLAVGAIGGQLSAGILLDRVDTPKIALLFFSVGLAGIGAIHFSTGPAMLIAGAIMLGFGQGAENSVIGYIASRLFGLKSFGALYGIIYAGASAAAGFGPLLTGFLYDLTGSYGIGLIVSEALLVVALLLIFTLRPYSFGGRNRNAVRRPAGVASPA